VLQSLAIANYRSLRDLIVPLGPLNLITGPNGSGKSNLYRALRLLAETAQGGVVGALAREGGLPSTLWAGPEHVSRAMRAGEVPVQGGPRQRSVAMKMGFASDQFGYCSVEIQAQGCLFSLHFQQPGLLRPLSAAELSDGTLRYLLWVAALHTPRPPPLMVLNEPETSLHPDLLPALARLIAGASQRSQVWVVSHASRLVAALREDRQCQLLPLEKTLSQTELVGQDLLDQPAWVWPGR